MPPPWYATDCIYYVNYVDYGSFGLSIAIYIISIYIIGLYVDFARLSYQ